MKSQIKMDSLDTRFIQILKGLFNVKCTNISIKSINKNSKRNRIKKNELDYFEYTYINDSPC